MRIFSLFIEAAEKGYGKFPRDVITDDHTLGGLKENFFFSLKVLEASSQRSEIKLSKKVSSS